jgi:hypothetical protein
VPVYDSVSSDEDEQAAVVLAAIQSRQSPHHGISPEVLPDRAACPCNHSTNLGSEEPDNPIQLLLSIHKAYL